MYTSVILNTYISCKAFIPRFVVSLEEIRLFLNNKNIIDKMQSISGCRMASKGINKTDIIIFGLIESVLTQITVF